MKETQDHARVVINPLLIYPIFILTGAGLQIILPLPFPAVGITRPVGLALAGLYLVIALPAVISMLRARTSLNPSGSSSKLVLSGPYRFSRNPMYLGVSLLHAGLACLLRLPWALLLMPVMLWLITVWVIKREEEYLERRYGTEYQNYRSSVGRWIQRSTPGSVR